MNRFADPKVFYAVIVPALVVVLLLASTVQGPLGARERELDDKIALLSRELARQGQGVDPVQLEQREQQLHTETTELEAIVARAHGLDQEPLVEEHRGQVLQLIEFEQERHAEAQKAADAAKAANVTLVGGGFDFLADAENSTAASRRPWAQLAMARIAVEHAIAAGVTSYEAASAPQVRELRYAAGEGSVAQLVTLVVKLYGPADRVQSFIERVTLKQNDGRAPLFVLHALIRKEGTARPDDASATIVLAGLVTPP